jgi:hypothetical protein
MKNLIAFLSLCFACIHPVFATDIFNQPFAYLSAPQPAQGQASQIGVWELKPVMMQSWIGITRGSDGMFNAEFLSGTGAGVSWQRTIIVNGEYYNSFCITGCGLFSPIISGQTSVKFAGALSVSVLNGWIGAGAQFNGRNVAGILTTNFNLL